MKPLDPAETPVHLAHRKGGKTGLVHGPAPYLPRTFTQAHKKRNKVGRKGAKARAKMIRVLQRRGIVQGG